MKFNDFLTEATTLDAEEALKYFEQLDRMINNKQFTAYIKEIDDNYIQKTNIAALLKKAQVAWNILSDEFYGLE